MSTAALIALVALFFVTSVVGVVTGSNSLITVPVMFQFGIPEKEAVATNMFGLVFMSVGATIPFVRRGAVDFRRTLPLVLITIVGSAFGATLVGYITDQSIKLIVTVGMIAVVLFTLVRKNGNSEKAVTMRPDNLGAPARKRFGLVLPVAYTLTFLLGIYGGVYSGGYVTILTAVFVAFLGMGFGEAVAATKWINVFSSVVATIVFMWQGLVNYRLGILLGVTMFAGAYLGACFAAKFNDLWLRRIFLATVFLLAIKTLFDLV